MDPMDLEPGYSTDRKDVKSWRKDDGEDESGSGRGLREDKSQDG